MELRKTRRYYLEAPVVFNWKDTNNLSRRCEGTTRDISTKALFIQTRDCPSIGDQLRIEVMLPALDSSSGVRLRAVGVVLRVQDSGQEAAGFAAAAVLRSDVGVVARLLKREAVSDAVQ